MAVTCPYSVSTTRGASPVDSSSSSRNDGSVATARHLLLAAGQRAGQLPPPGAQHRERLVHAGLDVGQADAEMSHQPEVIGDREVGEHAASLGQQADTPSGQHVRLGAGDGASVYGDRAGASRVQPGDDPQQGGLPGAVWPEHREQAALRHGQVDAVQHLDARIRSDDARQLQHRGWRVRRGVHCAVPADAPR
jgi:hypothetical protein